MARAKILDRIQKLVRLSENNSSVEEASLAAALAQKLMFEHKISRAEVEDTGDADEPIIRVDVLAQDGRTKVVSWSLSLLHVLAENNFCRVVHTAARAPHAGWPSRDKMTPGRMELFGRRGDVDAVLYLYRYLKREINRLCRRAAGQWASEQDGRNTARLFALTGLSASEALLAALRPNKRRWAYAFRHGAVATIHGRLKAQRQGQEEELHHREDGEAGLALVRQAEAAVDRHVQEQYPHLRNGSAPQISDVQGYLAGKAAAEDIALGTRTSRGLREPPRRIAP